MIKISKRIQFLASLLSPNDLTIADVGCDHGYLGYLHLQKNPNSFVYFTDISAPCLQKAEKLMQEHAFTKQCNFLCTDGLTGAPQNKLDCAVIAGMGGNEISKIIKQNQEVKKYILQPMKNVLPLKQQVILLGYKITYDCVFQDGKKFYQFIIFEKGKNTLTEKQMFLGKTNLEQNNSCFLNYLQHRKQQLQRNTKYNKETEQLKELNYIEQYLTNKE